MAISVRLYRHFSVDVPVVGLEKSQGHQLLDDELNVEGAGASCASHDAGTSSRRSMSGLEAKPGQVLLQASSRKVVASMLVEENFDVRMGGNRSNSTRESLVQSQPAAGLGGNVAITVQGLDCGVSIYAPDGVCPASCPYFAQEGAKEKACYFKCVKPAECGTLNAAEDIADPELLLCRKCRVLGCRTCAKGEGEKCAVCDSGYIHNPDGTCTGEMWHVWIVVFCVVGVVVAFLVAWLVRLQFLPVTNEEGLKEGLAYRSSLKLRVPKTQAGKVGADPDSAVRPLWPLSTNLHFVQVAGPGLTLHMNFQLALIIWGSGLVVTWVLFTYMTSPDMLTLGLYPVDTPQQMCSVTLRGKEVQKRLLPTKLVYMVFMYVATFVFIMAFALFQRQRFLEIDDETSMLDFAAMCEGLPNISGGQEVEQELQQNIEAATGEKVVGVSICWDYKENQEEIELAIDREVQLLEDIPQLPDQATLDQNNSGLGHKVFGSFDRIFSFTGELAKDAVSPGSQSGVEALLKDMSTTDSAFIVFESEASRDKAVEASKNKNVVIQGNSITLAKAICEPDTVNWTNFKVGQTEFYTKVFIGVVVIFLSLLLWCFGFYLPFAYFQASFAEQGEEPGFVSAFIFSMLVVVGNQIMYFLCGTIAENVGFRYNHSQEALYIGLYTMSCSVNLVVDMVMEFFLAYEAATAFNTHTADGRLLEDLADYQAIFESYVMQRAVGARLFAYCFPATFVIPFLMEPIFGIFLPYHICKLLLRTHPECRGREAEKSLNFFAPMDMARYGDLLLNFTLSVLIVLFPPGTFLKMMLALVVSHIFVYLYDQYRIMRCVPAFDYSSDYIDREVQVLMGVPPAIVAAAIVFKGGCLPDGPVCVEGRFLVWSCIGAFLVSLLIHSICIRRIVPLFDNTWKEHKVSEATYKEAATSMASTWFSENPVHCLRSKYVYKHDPPCLYNTRGKDYLIRKNPKCGVHFEHSGKVGCDEYDGSLD